MQICLQSQKHKSTNRGRKRLYHPFITPFENSIDSWIEARVENIVIIMARTKLQGWDYFHSRGEIYK